MFHNVSIAGEVKGMDSSSRRRGSAIGMLMTMFALVFGLMFAPMASADTPSPSDPSPSSSSSSSSTTPTEPSAPAAASGASDAWSLYALSSNVSGFFGNAMAPGGTSSDEEGADEEGATGGVGEKDKDCGGINCWDSVLKHAANGGDVVGFVDPTMTPGSKSWWASKNSRSSMTISYDSAKSISGEGINAATAKGPLSYMYFGATIQGLGLDSTSTGVGNNSVVTKIGGGALVIVYLMAALVDMVFSVVLKMLIELNPFQILFAGVSKINTVWASGMSPEGAGPFASFSRWVGDLFGALIKLQWGVVAPVMLIMLLAGYFLKKDFNHRSAVRRYVVRLLFFTIGIPLVGATYTGALNGIAGSINNTGTATMGSSRLVLSTFVDTRNWALGSRFSVPSDCADISWDTQTGSPTARSQANVRNTALCINSNLYRVYMDGTDKNPNNNISTSSPLFGEFRTMIPAAVSTDDKSYGSATSQDTWNRTMYSTDDGANGNNVSTLDVVQNTTSLLMSFAKNEHISASDFETGVKGYLSSLAVTSNPALVPLETTPEDGDAEPLKNADIIKTWFTSFSDPASMSTSNANRNMILTAGNRDSGLQVKGDLNKGVVRYSTNGGSTFDCGPKVVGDSKGEASGCNLSVLSTYNLLNSEFDSKAVTVYSSDTSTSTGNRMSHNAVSAVGTGALGWFYKADVFVTLLLFVYIGFSFALAMLVTNIRRSFQVLTAAIGSMTGSLQQIAKFVVYACVIIIEVIGTLFLYSVFEFLATSLPEVIGTVASRFIDFGDGIASGAGIGGFGQTINESGYVTLAIVGLSIAAKVWLMRHANKHRTSFLDAIEYSSTRAIEKVIDPNMSVSNAHKMAGDRGGEGMLGAGMGQVGKALGTAGHAARAGGMLGMGTLSGMHAGRNGEHGLNQMHAGSGSASRHLAGNGEEGSNANPVGFAGLNGDGGDASATQLSDDGSSPIAGLSAANAYDDGDIDNSSVDNSGMVDNSSDDDAVDGSYGDTTVGDGDSPSDVEARAAEVMDRGHLDDGTDPVNAGVDGAEGDTVEGDAVEGDQGSVDPYAPENIDGGVDGTDGVDTTAGDSYTDNGDVADDTASPVAFASDNASVSDEAAAANVDGVDNTDGTARTATAAGAGAAGAHVLSNDDDVQPTQAGGVDGATDSSMDATTFAGGDQTHDSSVADSSIDMGEQSPIDNSNVDADYNGVTPVDEASADSMGAAMGSSNVSDAGSNVASDAAAAGAAGASAGGVVADNASNDASNVSSSPVENATSGTSDATPVSFADNGANNEVPSNLDSGSSNSGMFNESAALDTSQVESASAAPVANTSGESSASTAGQFNDDAVLDTSSQQIDNSGAGSTNIESSWMASQLANSGVTDAPASSEASTPMNTSGANENVVAPSTSSEPVSSGVGQFNNDAVLDTSASQVDNSTHAVAADTGADNVQSVADNAPSSVAAPSQSVDLSSASSAFDAGRSDAPISASSLENASNTSVAAADLGEVVSDLRAGNFGEAVRDVAAAGGALFGARTLSESVLNNEGASSAGAGAAGAAAGAGAAAAGGASGQSGVSGTEQTSGAANGAGAGGVAPEASASGSEGAGAGAASSANAEGLDLSNPATMMGAGAAGLAASSLLRSHGGSSSSSSSGGESGGSGGDTSQSQSHDSSTSMGSNNGDRKHTANHVSNSTHNGSGGAAAVAGGAAGAAAARAAGVPRPASTPNPAKSSRRRRRGNGPVSFDPLSQNGSGSGAASSAGVAGAAGAAAGAAGVARRVTGQSPIAGGRGGNTSAPGVTSASAGAAAGSSSRSVRRATSSQAGQTGSNTNGANSSVQRQGQQGQGQQAQRNGQQAGRPVQTNRSRGSQHNGTNNHGEDDAMDV